MTSLVHFLEVLVALVFVGFFYPRELDGGTSLISKGVPTDFHWENSEKLIFETRLLNISLLLYPNGAPKSTEAFKLLVKQGYFNDCRFEKKYGLWDKLSCNQNKNVRQGQTPPVLGFESKLPFKKGFVALAWDGIVPDILFSNANHAADFIYPTEKPLHVNGKYNVIAKVIDGPEAIFRNPQMQFQNVVPLLRIIFEKNQVGNGNNNKEADEETL